MVLAPPRAAAKPDADPAADGGPVRSLGLPSATTLVIDSIIGTGVFTAGYQAVYQAMLLLLIGIPIYAFLKARRERRGEVAEPAELTVDGAVTSLPVLHPS